MNSITEIFQSVPFLIGRVEDEGAYDELVQYVLSSIDIKNPPRDSKIFDVIKDTGPIGEKIKNKIIDPLFEKYLKETGQESLEYFKKQGCDFRAWINPAGSGYKIDVHRHPNAVLCSVFYLLFDENDKGGEIVFVDPNDFSNKKIILPRSKDFIIFPNYVFHYTTLFTGNLRLMVAVDLMTHDKSAIETYNLWKYYEDGLRASDLNKIVL